MISEVYSAFRKAGVPEEDARQAAEALSAESLATKSDISGIKQELAIIKWMLGIVIAAQILPLIRSLGLL
jgi:LDH2 family malate/lactate/ureidoglycolate dehydrogenase